MGWLVPVVLVFGGCAGDGSALIEDMTGGEGIQPTLSSIQSEVFGAICIECHVPGGPGPMPLDTEDAAFQNLVNVRSIEIPALLRVNPGDSENSYIVHKIQGRLTILGTRMPPPPRPMLTPEQIAAIMEWIDSGAPR